MSEAAYAIDSPEFMNTEDIELNEEWLDGLPQPRLWRVLILPVVPKRITRGGIELPQQAIEDQKYLTYMGRVLAIGPAAFKDPKFANEEIPQLGDYVIYGKYAGQPLIYKGAKIITLNDDEILASVPNPDALKVHF